MLRRQRGEQDGRASNRPSRPISVLLTRPVTHDGSNLVGMQLEEAMAPAGKAPSPAVAKVLPDPTGELVQVVVGVEHEHGLGDLRQVVG